MDRDIEQTADAATPLVGRDDAAMVDRAYDAALDAFMASNESLWTAVQAAAAVIVPATAERIAVAFEHEGHIGFTHFAAVARSFAAGSPAGATTGEDNDE